MKVLVGAWACNPRQGSEAAVGWGWLSVIKDQHDVHVLTAPYQRDWIESEISRTPDEFSRVHFHYVAPPFLSYDYNGGFWRWQKDIPLLVPIFHRYYHRWMRAAYRTALDLHCKVHFDLVHQLTFVSFRFPGHLWKLGIPFVWGPLGGFENTPWRLLPAMGAGGAAYYAGRNLVNSAQKRFLRAPRRAFRRASAVIAATSGMQAEIRRWYGTSSEVICEVGSHTESSNEFLLRAPSEPLRIVWSGLHLPGKALHLLLHALRGRPENWHLDIYGDGPCRSQWQSLASRLGIDRQCTWHGQVSRHEALNGLRKAHLFVITSLKDLTSNVIVEALACGVPVICPDHCGFTDVITEQCGIKVPIHSPKEFERLLAAAIADLGSDEEQRRQLAAGALRRVREFSWEFKAAAIDRIYRRAIEKCSSIVAEQKVLRATDA